MGKKNVISILVANYTLEKIGGTETFTFTMIEELVSRGYEVEYFTFLKGLTSDKIENDLKVRFMSKKKYDLILANHNLCVESLYRYGYTIQTCHGVAHKLEQPSSFADFHVSISQEIQLHLEDLGFKSKIIYNGINLQRFSPRNKISNKVQKLLSLSQAESLNDFLKEICDEKDIRFSSLNKFTNPIWDVENIINDNDIVIGLGRSAYDSFACGRPVIILDNRSYNVSFIGDGYSDINVDKYLLNNCSGRFKKEVFDKNIFLEELEKYNISDSVILRKFAEENFDIKLKIVDYLSLYQRRNKFKFFVRNLYVYRLFVDFQIFIKIPDKKNYLVANFKFFKFLYKLKTKR